MRIDSGEANGGFGVLQCFRNPVQMLNVGAFPCYEAEGGSGEHWGLCWCYDQVSLSYEEDLRRLRLANQLTKTKAVKHIIF